jgi:hypothetical protein
MSAETDALRTALQINFANLLDGLVEEAVRAVTREQRQQLGTEDAAAKRLAAVERRLAAVEARQVGCPSCQPVGDPPCQT